ncbi:DMT family transporter [Actinoallomurus sp. NPDC052308]|uniref:DMT family transporter n=1 Tax=Actinoallomurus sp. NPDC052308 TaxID=3155530 RepID=UPI003434CE02
MRSSRDSSCRRWRCREGGLALVQPLLVAELPLTMIFIARLSQVHLGRRVWLAVGAMTAGLAGFLGAASPTPGRRPPGVLIWVTAAVVTVGVIVGIVFLARSTSGPARVALLGVTAGLGFAFTATFMKATTGLAGKGLAVLLTSWEPYAMVAAGFGSLFLLQNALQSGTLVAAQPALTITDPVASILYGVTMFGEGVRTGGWVIAEIAGFALICYGTLRLSRSRIIQLRSEAA